MLVDVHQYRRGCLHSRTGLTDKRASTVGAYRQSTARPAHRRTLHIVAVCVNRIGKKCTFLKPHSFIAAQPRRNAEPQEFSAISETGDKRRLQAEVDFQGFCENLELNEKNRADYCLTGFGHGKTESRPSIQLRNWTASGWSMAWQTSEIAPMTSRGRRYLPPIFVLHPGRTFAARHLPILPWWHDRFASAARRADQ